MIFNRSFSGTTRIESWKSYGVSEDNIEKITKSETKFAPMFSDHHLLPDVNFNGHCLTKNNISIFKKVIKSKYFLYTKSTIKKFKHGFYIR